MAKVQPTTQSQGAGESGQEQGFPIAHPKADARGDKSGEGARANETGRDQSQAKRVSKDSGARARELEAAWEEDASQYGYHVPPQTGEHDGADRLLHLTARQGKPLESGKSLRASEPFSQQEIDGLLKDTANLTSEDRTKLLSLVRAQPSLIRRVRNGEGLAFLQERAAKLIGKGDKTEAVPLDSKMQKITKGASEYMGGDVRKIVQIGKATEVAKSLAEKKVQVRELLGRSRAVTMTHDEITEQLQTAASSLRDTKAVADNTNKEFSEDQVKAAREKLPELYQEVSVLVAADSLVDQYRQMSDDEKRAELQKIDAAYGVLQPDIDTLTQKYNEINNGIANEAAVHGEVTKEFIQYMDDLPEMLTSNPELGRNAQAFAYYLQKERIKKTGEELFATLLLYLFGMGAQQMQESLQAA